MNFMSPKIIDRHGREAMFDRKIIENDLKSFGMPERVAELIAEAIENRVQEGWTTTQIWQETDLELGRTQDNVRRAHMAYNASGSKFGSSTRTQVEIETEAR